MPTEQAGILFASLWPGFGGGGYGGSSYSPSQRIQSPGQSSMAMMAPLMMAAEGDFFSSDMMKTFAGLGLMRSFAAMGGGGGYGAANGGYHDYGPPATTGYHTAAAAAMAHHAK